MNILSHIPFLSGDTSTDEETLDEVAIALKEKRERIEFHRHQVRNGPANWRTQSSGQVKRAKVRALAGRTRKARRAQIRDFHAQQREHATLRGHLQAIGVVAYETDFVPTAEARFQSARWIVNNHSEAADLELSETEFLRRSVQRAFDRFADISGVERSEVEYA